MGRPKSEKLPFENKFGFISQDRNNPYVQDFLNVQLDPDPGAERRGQLAEQASENRWNNAFTAGIPQQVRMMLQGSEQRQIREGTAADRRQANFQRNQAELARRGQLLPQMVQTSGFTSTQGQPGFFGRLGNAFADQLGGRFI